MMTLYAFSHVIKNCTSADLNPIEMAFTKLKTLLRKRQVRAIEALWNAIGDICTLFTPKECENYLKAAGYAPS